MPSLQSTWLRPVLLIGILVAFALRLHHLGAQSLWYDETVSAHLASQSAQELIAHTARDIHPPAYYLLLHGWRSVSRPTPAHGLEFLYTWPSLWFGMLSVALMAALARRHGGIVAASLALFLGAVNPFQVMYAQEVRMYTVGATCVLLSLWSAAKYLDASSECGGRVKQWPPLIAYTAAVIAGLYTLYYFLFWLAVLIPLVTFQLARIYRRNGLSPLRRWLLAHLAIFIAWLPWLPIFVRQALNPPVPPWRAPWTNSRDLLGSLAEALAAPLVGQSPPGMGIALWAAVVVAVISAYVVYTKNNPQAALASRWALPVLLVGPGALIVAISLTIAPIYHVRYLVTYAALFPVLAALVTCRLRARPILAAGLFALLLTISVSALVAFWRAPELRADDHRSAVAALAQNWRPGDVILANAGWIYPALEVYWPKQLAGPLDAIPPALAEYARLMPPDIPVELPLPSPLEPAPAVPVVRTGSIDAPPSLGWAHPDSDFFAISTQDTLAALDRLAASHARIWHYRLYDTVNDPDELIRGWLAAYTPFFEATFPGPGYLRLEGYTFAKAVQSQGRSAAEAEIFGDTLRLRDSQAPTSLPAGAILYVATSWETLAAPPALAASLRLYASDGVLAAQQDAALAVHEPEFGQTLALPVPAATPPGRYALELVIYRQDDLQPLSVAPQQPSSFSLRLASVDVALPATPPPVTSVSARFDYIDLVSAHVPVAAAPGAPLSVDLVWRPRPSAYRDNYTIRLALEDESKGIVHLGDIPLGTADYPSAAWPAGYPVRRQLAVQLPSDLSEGRYRLTLSLLRAADELVIPAKRALGILRSDQWELGQLEIVP